MNGFEKAAVDAAPRLGAAVLRNLADRIARGWPDHAILGGGSEWSSDAARLLLVARKESSVPDAEAGAFLRGIVAAQEQLTTSVTVETVWSGPNSHAVLVRATAQALIEVIAEAKHELLLMTYSAKPHEDIRAAFDQCRRTRCRSDGCRGNTARRGQRARRFRTCRRVLVHPGSPVVAVAGG